MLKLFCGDSILTHDKSLWIFYLVQLHFTTSHNKEKYKELNKIVDFLMPSFSLNSKALVSNSNLELANFEMEHCNRIKGEYMLYNDHNAYDYYRVIENNIGAILVKSEKNGVKKWCCKYFEDKHLTYDFHFNLIKQIIAEGRNIDVAAGHLLKIENKMISNPVAAYDMKDFYMKCAKVAYLYSKEKSREYIKKAFDVMADVDEEAYRRIELFEKISRKLDSSDKDIGLAYNFSRIIEDCYRKLNNTKHLPVDSIFKLLCNIHPSSAIATACRWEDRDDEYIVLGYEISIPNIINDLLSERAISVDMAIALSNLDICRGIKYNDIVKNVLIHLDDCKKKKQEEAIKVLIDNIDAMTSGFACSYAIRKIVKWNETKEFEAVANISEKYRFIEECSSTGYRTNGYENKKLSWQQVTKEEIIFDYKSLDLVMDKLEDVDTANLLDYVIENTGYDGQINISKILVHLVITGNYKWHSNEMINRILGIFDEWEEYNPIIKECRLDKKYISEIIDELWLQPEYSQEKLLPFILKLFDGEIEFIYFLYQKHVALYLKEESWRIYSFLGNLTILESRSNCYELLKWCCEEELKWVHSKSGDEKFSNNKVNNFSVEDSFAIYISKMLGHAEKNKRWYAMHALYDLFLLGNIELIELTIGITQTGIPDIYSDCDYSFFKDAAKISLFMVLRKISVFKPDFLQKYIDEFRIQVLSKTPMNILQRELLRQIIIIYRPDDNDIKGACDLVHSKKIPHTRLYRGKKEVDTKFHFDSLDIVPKIYQFLGNIFQKSDWEVAKYCDSWIENLGYTNDIVEHWNDRFKTRDYYTRTYGGDTIVEDLSKYLQFNSMFYTADQFRMELPTDDDEYPIYTFAEWVKSWLTKYENNWAIDAKTIVPCIKYLMDTERYVKDSKYSISDDIFEHALNGEGDNFILDLDDTIEYAKSNKRYSISVAFINEKDLSNLQNSVSQKNYHINWDYVDDDSEDSDWRNKGFMLCTTDYYANDHDNSLEKYDPYLHDMSLNFIRLSKELRDFYGCENCLPFEYINPTSNMPAETKYWSYKSDDRIYNFYCDGRALFIKKTKLIEYMTSNFSKLLVAEIDVHYSDAYEYYG